MFVVTIALVCIGLAATALFNGLYFLFVLPYMRQRRPRSVTWQAALGLIAGQIGEYCRLARQSEHRRMRRVARLLRWSMLVACATMSALLALAFWEAACSP